MTPEEKLKELEEILMDMLQSEFEQENAAADYIIHRYRRMTADVFFADLIFNGRMPL
jgi:hypothetical protein